MVHDYRFQLDFDYYLSITGYSAIQWPNLDDE